MNKFDIMQFLIKGGLIMQIENYINGIQNDLILATNPRMHPKRRVEAITTLAGRALGIFGMTVGSTSALCAVVVLVSGGATGAVSLLGAAIIFSTFWDLNMISHNRSIINQNLLAAFTTSRYDNTIFAHKLRRIIG